MLEEDRKTKKRSPLRERHLFEEKEIQTTLRLTMTTVGAVTHVSYGGKYRKRRKQKKQKRLEQALCLFGVALLVLLYTIFSLFTSSPQESIPPEESLQQASSPEHAKKPKLPRFMRPKQFLNFHQQQDEESSSLSSKENQKQLLRSKKTNKGMLEQMLQDLDTSIVENKNNGIRWIRPELLPHLGGEKKTFAHLKQPKKKHQPQPKDVAHFFKVNRKKTSMAWENEDIDSTTIAGVDFTKHSYEYPEKLMELPETLGDYPLLRPLKDIMEAWPQEDIDSVPTPFQETLIHFDYTKPEDIEAARKFRDAKLPFKFINVPEIVAAGEKWTDEYVSANFGFTKATLKKYGITKIAQGTAQESSDSFFAFFVPEHWPVDEMGIPPTRNNDWTYVKWAEHARYADAAGLDPHAPHFYFQSGVPREERNQPKTDWTFISKDLPSLSSPTETFFVFNPESQKGIQCRFGERGVTAATHYDGGRNMVAMITGAKRYILSPPNQCPKLGLHVERFNPIYRHSLLNFGHLNYMDDEEMPADERAWLERSAGALSIDTVLKAGEVLYIPSHWFHYISSLQKSAQCNVRSGVDVEGDEVFGGEYEVTEGCVPE